MPAMSTPLKALIQERLRAKIVRQSDEDYDYEGDMYAPTSTRVQAPPPATMHGSYALAECKERSLPMSTPSMSSSASSSAATSASSSAGFPLHLHTEIDPAAYIPHGHPLSTRGYIPHHPGALSPSPSFGRHGHRQHQSHYHRHQRCGNDVAMYHDSRHAYSSRPHHDMPPGLELLSSPRWSEPPRDLLRVTSPSPPSRGHLHRQSSGDLHSQRWQDKGSVAVHHRRERRRYDEDGDNDNNSGSRGERSPMREFRHERKRERRQEYLPDSQAASGHRMRELNSNENNQLWHDVPMAPSKFSFKSHADDREPIHSVRPAERAPSYASTLTPSMQFTADRHRYGHRHHHHRTQQQEEEDDASEESMASLMLLPPSDTRERPLESQPLSKDLRPAPTPLDLSVVACSRQRTRTFDQILSPDSRLAANAFVEKRQRRSGKSTPRTMATQHWLRSLDLREEL